MQAVVVAHELDIADLEDHVQSEPLASALKDMRGLQLRLGQRRDFADIGEAGKGLDVVRIPLDVDLVVVPVEDLGLDVGLLANGNLALAVEVPDGLGEGAGDIGTLALESVPDVVGGDNVGLAALLGAVDAEKADKVGVVAVEELASVGTVDADFVNLGRVLAKVLDVAENVSVAILRDEVSAKVLVWCGIIQGEEEDEPKVGADAHVGSRGLLNTPFLDGEALEEDEAVAVDQIIAELGEEGDEVFRKGKVLLCCGIY